MGINQQWFQFPASYRETEVRTVAHWIGDGISGRLLESPAWGGQRFLEFLSYRLDALQPYLPPRSTSHPYSG